MDRRTLIRWVMTAAAAAPAWDRIAWAAAASVPAAAGYGTDPDLTKTYRPGDLWPLTFSPAQRELAAALATLIIPADERSPGAADVGVHLFIDEWVSAPNERFGTAFAAAGEAQQRSICDAICWEAKADPRHAAAARFFARFRDLTADGFYTTPEGTRDLGYTGNVPLARFDGPPPEALRKAGLEEKS
jgi:hypothetical protein